MKWRKKARKTTEKKIISIYNTCTKKKPFFNAIENPFFSTSTFPTHFSNSTKKIRNYKKLAKNS